MKRVSVYNFLLLIVCFCGLPVMAMEKQGNNCEQKEKKSEEGKVKKKRKYVRREKLKDFLKKGHCIEGERDGLVKNLMSYYCFYCGKNINGGPDGIKRHLAGNKSKSTSSVGVHKVDLDKNFENQDFSSVLGIPEKCPFAGCKQVFPVNNKERAKHIAKHFVEKNNESDNVNGGQVTNLVQALVANNFVNNINYKPLVGPHFDEIRPLFGLDQGKDRLLPSFTDLNSSVEEENKKNKRKRKHDELIGSGNKKLGGQENKSSCGSEECDEEECSESKEKDSEGGIKRRKME